MECVSLSFRFHLESAQTLVAIKLTAAAQASVHNLPLNFTAVQ